MIISSGELIRELRREMDDFITVEIEGKEYVIDMITRRKNYTEAATSHLCVKCRNGGTGEIRR